MFSLRHTGRARRPCELRHNGRSFSYVTPVDRCFRYVTLVDICFSNVTPVDRCFSNVTPVEHVDVLAKSHADAVLIGMNWNFHRINESLLGWAKRGHRLSVFVNIAVDKSVLKLTLRAVPSLYADAISPVQVIYGVSSLRKSRSGGDESLSLKCSGSR